ncbi:MAG: GNAT family N-acetyltransferase [Hyphomicrobiaceae bacterium]
METLQTERLILRPVERRDADDIARFAGDWDVARMTARIPHPYMIADALAFIESQGPGDHFAVTREGAFVGCCGTTPAGEDGTDISIGYWIGKPYWGHGYATEAARAVLGALVARTPRPRILISHMAENGASGRVIAKLGFQPTGEKMLWCAARGQEVRCLTYVLPDRE